MPSSPQCALSDVSSQTAVKRLINMTATEREHNLAYCFAHSAAKLVHMSVPSIKRECQVVFKLLNLKFEVVHTTSNSSASHRLSATVLDTSMPMKYCP